MTCRRDDSDVTLPPRAGSKYIARPRLRLKAPCAVHWGQALSVALCRSATQKKKRLKVAAEES